MKHGVKNMRDRNAGDEIFSRPVLYKLTDTDSSTAIFETCGKIQCPLVIVCCQTPDHWIHDNQTSFSVFIIKISAGLHVQMST